MSRFENENPTTEVRVGKRGVAAQWVANAKENHLMLAHLPYLHFLVKTQQGRESSLLSPAEIAPDEFAGGSFFAPVNDNGSLLPAYRFDFSIYRGKGKFLQSANDRKMFNGMAFSAVEHRREVLICTFE